VALDETYGSRNIQHKATGTRLFTVSLTGGIVTKYLVTTITNQVGQVAQSV
jgi:hypothetical protein